jgi:hypothetical protein
MFSGTVMLVQLWGYSFSFLAIGFFISFAANSGLPTTREQYSLALDILFVPTGFSLICYYFLSDTLRHLASQDRVEDAMAVLKDYGKA